MYGRNHAEERQPSMETGRGLAPYKKKTVKRGRLRAEERNAAGQKEALGWKPKNPAM